MVAESAKIARYLYFLWTRSAIFEASKTQLYLLVGEAIRTMLRFCGGEYGSFASKTIFNHLTFFSKVQEDLNRWFFFRTAIYSEKLWLFGADTKPVKGQIFLLYGEGCATLF